MAFDPDGTVLVTGGTGMLGVWWRGIWSLSMVWAICCWLVVGGRRLRVLVSCGRSWNLWVRDVRIVACDVSDREELRALLESVSAGSIRCGVWCIRPGCSMMV